MNLRDLRYLVALAEHLHFGRAAEACFVSQPTLSTQIRKLEEELKVTLIERANRQVILTPVGAAVVAQAHRVLRDVDDLMRIAEEHRDPLGGDVRVGIIPTVAPYLLPRILPIIRREFPKVSIKLNEGQTRVIVRMLGDGELDALILALPVNEDHVVQVKLYSEPFYLAVSKQHPKAGRKAVSLDDLERRAGAAARRRPLSARSGARHLQLAQRGREHELPRDQPRDAATDGGREHRHHADAGTRIGRTRRCRTDTSRFADGRRVATSGWCGAATASRAELLDRLGACNPECRCADRPLFF